jgi:hypothetical protein
MMLAMPVWRNEINRKTKEKKISRLNNFKNMKNRPVDTVKASILFRIFWVK